MGYAATYSTTLLPGGIFLGTVLLLLIVPVFAMAALAVVLFAALALIAGVAVLVIAGPCLLIAAAARRLSAGTRAAARRRAVGHARWLPDRRRRAAAKMGAKLRA